MQHFAEIKLFLRKKIPFPNLYDCRKHGASHNTSECPVTESKPALQNFRKFGNADDEGINNYLVVTPFHPICHTNNNKICGDVYKNLDQVIEIYVPTRARHRQCLTPWIISHTCKILKQLNTQKSLFEGKLTSYRKQQFQKLENSVTDSSE